MRLNRRCGQRGSRRGSRRGFTLLEVLATIMLLGIILPAVMQAISLATAASGEAKHKVEAVSLAQSKLAELAATSQFQAAASSGDFGPDYPGYQWATSVQTTDLNLTTISVRVSWFARGRDRYVELTSMVYNTTAMDASSGSESTTASGTGTGTTR